MSLQTWADALLRADDLGTKLAPPADFDDDPRAFDLPDAPGRPASLRFGEARSAFPKSLAAPLDRARAMHFFANHELLAIELMALALLRFGDAPASWRRGLARVIVDEQRHFRLYQQRMGELGLEFGEVPVNATFWRTLAPQTQREAFIAGMALTFEQANLDHCVYYEAAFRRVGDEASADLMRTIHRDEIGHVAHGLVAADIPRGEAASSAGDRLWDWWSTHLPDPLTPARARGLAFDREGRKRCGFPAEFIDRLELYSHSRGRPPDVWWFHPHHEGALAGQHPTKIAATLEHDLAALLAFEARADDVVLVRRLPSEAHLRRLKSAGVDLPRFCPVDAAPDYLKAGRIRPWGEDAQVARTLAAWSRIAQHPCTPDPRRAELASKLTALDLLQATFVDEPGLIPVAARGRRCTTWPEVEAALAEWPGAMVKAPLSTAGRDRVVGPHREWTERILRDQGAVLVQPRWTRVVDVSIQAHIEGETLHLDGITRFATDDTGRFLGVEVGRPWDGCDPAIRRFAAEFTVDQQLARSARAFAARAIPLGFHGPFGIDAMIVAIDGKFALHPLLEVNARHTMGRVAWALRRQLAGGISAHWTLFRRPDFARWGFADEAEFRRWVDDHPLERRADGRWAEGVLLTTDWDEKTTVGSLVAVGECANRLRPPRTGNRPTP